MKSERIGCFSRLQPTRGDGSPDLAGEPRLCQTNRRIRQLEVGKDVAAAFFAGDAITHDRFSHLPTIQRTTGSFSVLDLPSSRRWSSGPGEHVHSPGPLVESRK